MKNVPMAHEAESCAHAHVDGKHEAEESAEPTADLQFAASDVSSADFDVARATSEFTDRLNRLYSHMNSEERPRDT